MLQKPKRRKQTSKKAAAHAGPLTTNGRGRTTAKRRAARKNPHGSGGLPKGDVTYHERQFDRLMSAIEDGNLTKINKAKLEGRLAGYSPREVEYLIYRSRMAAALKRNPAPKVIAEAVKLVGNGGRFKQFLARRKAASAFRKELRLEAALDRARTRKKVLTERAKAKANPKRKSNAKAGIGKKAVARSTRTNPKAAASAKSPIHPARKRNAAPRSRTFEMFQGRKPTNTKPTIVSRHAPATLVQLGDLIELKLHGQAPIKLNPKLVKLCAANGKLWIAGKRFAKPNPAAKVNEINPVGEIDHVVYGTHKPHHGDHAYTHFIHRLGEETGHRPLLCVDREGFPVIRGGRYKIQARGIVN